MFQFPRLAFLRLRVTQKALQLPLSLLFLILVGVSVLDWQKFFFANFSSFVSPRKRETRIGIISLGRLVYVFVSVLFIVKFCVCKRNMPCALEINSNGILTREHVKACSSSTIKIISPLPQYL